VDAIGRFLDLWAAEASAQGWTAADLFGADAVRPGSSWLNAGPLWSGNGAEVVAVMPDKIEFSMPDGSRQFHYRRPHLRPRILPWEFAA
ncbi:MAG TPA: hypothetical protein VKS60_12770, partial [Stellaceae bacterium]|nr:hypothetical protein [Stellaceae bacterium]